MRLSSSTRVATASGAKTAEQGAGGGGTTSSGAWCRRARSKTPPGSSPRRCGRRRWLAPAPGPRPQITSEPAGGHLLRPAQAAAVGHRHPPLGPADAGRLPARARRCRQVAGSARGSSPSSSGSKRLPYCRSASWSRGGVGLRGRTVRAGPPPGRRAAFSRSDWRLRLVRWTPVRPDCGRAASPSARGPHSCRAAACRCCSWPRRTSIQETSVESAGRRRAGRRGEDDLVERIRGRPETPRGVIASTSGGPDLPANGLFFCRTRIHNGWLLKGGPGMISQV